MKLQKTPELKIEMFATHIPAWGWFDYSSIKVEKFVSKEDADTYLKDNDLLGHGFEFRVVPC